VLGEALQILFSSLTLGSIYALVALGLVLIFKAADRINFGQGEWVLAGAYIALTLLIWELPLWAIFIVAPLVGAVLGVLLDVGIFRRLAASTGWIFVVASIAVGGLLREIAHVKYEANIFRFPSLFSRDTFQIVEGAFLTQHNIWVVACTAFIVMLLWLFFEYTRVGKAMQGVAQNRTGASIVGINVRTMLSLAFALSMVVSTFAGLLVAPQVGVSPQMGDLVVKGFVAAAFGGLGSFGGAVIGGVVVALTENLTNIYITTTYRDVIVFSLLLLVMWLRPTGLFGREEARRV
jgi:branched-chain amino acid transport system permease protein